MKRGTQSLRFILEYVERRYTLLAKSVIERMKQTEGQNKNKQNSKELYVIIDAWKTQKLEKKL